LFERQTYYSENKRRRESAEFICIQIQADAVSGVECHKIWGSGSVRSNQAPWKISFTFHIWHKSFHSWWCETCSYPTTVL